MDTLEVVPTGLGALPVADPLSVEAHVPLATPVLQGLVDPIGALVDDVASVHLGGGPIDAVPLATPNFVEDIANPGDDSGTSAPAAEDHRGKLFIGGLSWETTVDGLRAYFEKYGEVTDCVVMSNAHTGRSRGFGFITFSDPAVAKHVIENGPHTLDNREIDPKPAVPKGGAPGRKNKARGRQNQQQNQTAIKTKKIFVGGLAPESNEESLKEFFGTHGTVEDVILMYDRETKRPRGFGFVTFSSEEPVDKLVALRYVELNDKQVEIKAALPKSTIGEGNRRNNRNNFSGNNSRSGSQSQSQGQFPYPYGGGYNANYQQGFQQGYGRPGQPGQFQQGQYAGYPQNYGQGNAQSQAAQAAAYSQAAQYYEYNARANAGYQMEHGMQQQQYQQGGAEGQQNYDNMMAQGQGQNGQSQYYSTFGQGQQPGSGRPGSYQGYPPGSMPGQAGGEYGEANRFPEHSSYGEYGAGQAGTASSEQEPAQFSLGGTPIGGGPIGSGVAPGRPGDALPDALGVRGLDTPAELAPGSQPSGDTPDDFGGLGYSH